MNPALQLLASVVPPDSAGARSANRFNFQRDWVLCRLLELHQTGRNYVIVCDYHDDVLIIDAATDCKTIDFFQVKTDKVNRFTLSKLLERKKHKAGPGPSILGKLYAHRFRFPGSIGSTTLVTNLPPKVTAASLPSIEDRDQWTVIDLASSEQEKIRKLLGDELVAHGGVVLDKSLAFETTPLPVTDHETFAAGAVARFLERIQADGDLAVQALYRAIVGEIERRSTAEGVFSTTEAIIERKCITRDLFAGVLQRCLSTSRRGLVDVVERLVTEAMTAAGAGIRATKNTSRAVRKYALQRVDRNNLQLERLAEMARRYRDDLSEPDLPLIGVMRVGMGRLRSLKEAQGLGDDQLMAIVAWEFIDDGEPVPPTPKHEDQAT